jgi:hypothetical protein
VILVVAELFCFFADVPPEEELADSVSFALSGIPWEANGEISDWQSFTKSLKVSQGSESSSPDFIDQFLLSQLPERIWRS